MGKTHYTAVLYYLFLFPESPESPVPCLTLMDQKSSALTAVPYYSAP